MINIIDPKTIINYQNQGCGSYGHYYNGGSTKFNGRSGLDNSSLRDVSEFDAVRVNR